jgi:hypothetical protein
MKKNNKIIQNEQINEISWSGIKKGFKKLVGIKDQEIPTSFGRISKFAKRENGEIVINKSKLRDEVLNSVHFPLNKTKDLKLFNKYKSEFIEMYNEIVDMIFKILQNNLGKDIRVVEQKLKKIFKIISEGPIGWNAYNLDIIDMHEVYLSDLLKKYESKYSTSYDLFEFLNSITFEEIRLFVVQINQWIKDIREFFQKEVEKYKIKKDIEKQEKAKAARETLKLGNDLSKQIPKKTSAEERKKYHDKREEIIKNLNLFIGELKSVNNVLFSFKNVVDPDILDEMAFFTNQVNEFIKTNIEPNFKQDVTKKLRLISNLINSFNLSDEQKDSIKKELLNSLSLSDNFTTKEVTESKERFLSFFNIKPDLKKIIASSASVNELFDIFLNIAKIREDDVNDRIKLLKGEILSQQRTLELFNRYGQESMLKGEESFNIFAAKNKKMFDKNKQILSNISNEIYSMLKIYKNEISSEEKKEFEGLNDILYDVYNQFSKKYLEFNIKFVQYLKGKLTPQNKLLLKNELINIIDIDFKDLFANLINQILIFLSSEKNKNISKYNINFRRSGKFGEFYESLLNKNKNLIKH